MKKLLLTLAAAAMMSIPAVAENLNQDSGTVNETGKTAYNWEYWNDVKTTQDYAVWPNWKIVYETPLAEAPANVAMNYVLKKGSAVGEVVATGAANNSTNGDLKTQQATFYAGPIPALGEGTFVMECTMTLIPAGQTDPEITTFSTTFTSEAAPEAEYNFEFQQTTTTTANEISIEYAFVEKNGKAVPEDAEYHFEPGIVGPGNKISTTQSGTVVFDGLNPDTNYTIYSNNPWVKIDGKQYYTAYPNWDARTSAGDPALTPKATLTYELKNASATEKGKFIYSIAVENIEESAITGYRVWLDAPGNVTVGESTAKEGTVEVDVPAAGVSYWAKGQITYTDGDQTKTLNTTPNDFEVHFIVVSNPDAEVPTITLKCSNPEALSGTTGTIDYVITTDKPELEGVTYKLWAVSDGDRAVSDVEEVTALTGKLNLKDLNNFSTTDLWVKAQAVTTDGGMSNVAQYPGAAEGHYGFSIDTSSMAGENDPVMPAIRLTASNAIATSATTATIDYNIALTGDKWKDDFFKSFEIFVVTNAFGADVEVARKTIDNVADLAGTLTLTGLKPNFKNDLWVKGTLTLINDVTSKEEIYPGAPEGHYGFSVTTPEEGDVAIENVEADNDAPAVYFNLQGQRVNNPANGLFIMVKGNKATKVIR